MGSNPLFHYNLHSPESVNKTVNGIYTPDHCLNTTCAYLLAPRFYYTKFVIQHIDEMKFYVNVIWLGEDLEDVVRNLLKKYENRKNIRSKFMVLYWTPSELIDIDIEYTSIVMPSCEEMPLSSQDTGCKYDMTPIIKFSAERFKEANYAHDAFRTMSFSVTEMKDLLKIYKKYRYPNGSSNSTLRTDNLNNNEWKMAFNYIACEWLKGNKEIYKYWIPMRKKETIDIGGIFPITGLSTVNGYGIYQASNMAVKAINQNRNILGNHDLNIIEMDGECKVDTVLKAFLNYYARRHHIVGILGPACSETVEPIAGKLHF